VEAEIGPEQDMASGKIKIPAGNNYGSDLKAERSQRVSRDWVFENSAKAQH
jgi:hypothetical protein